MKKFLTAVCLAVLVALSGVWMNAIVVHANDISVEIDGTMVIFGDAGPVTVDGRILVPIRDVFEALGFNVNWDDATQTAILSDDNHEIRIPIGSNTFTTNGTTHSLDVPAQLIGGRTMIPLRAPLESVGHTLGWNDATQTVLVTTAAPIVPPVAEVPEEPPVGEEDEVVVFYSHEVTIGDFVLRIERLTPHEVLGGIEVDGLPFSVVLIPDDEPYFLQRYIPISHPEGVYIRFTFYGINLLVYHNMASPILDLEANPFRQYHPALFTTNRPLELRFGPRWFDGSRTQGTIYDHALSSYLWNEVGRITDGLYIEFLRYQDDETIEQTWTAIRDLTHALHETGTSFFSNYVVLTQDQLRYFDETGTLPLPFIRALNPETRMWEYTEERYSMEEWRLHTFLWDIALFVDELTNLLNRIDLP